jgi:hypothetical protein
MEPIRSPRGIWSVSKTWGVQIDPYQSRLEIHIDTKLEEFVALYPFATVATP